MNHLEQDFLPLLDMGMDVLAEAIAEVDGTELEYTPAGENVSLGELCRSMGDVAHAYAASYRSGRMDFSLSACERDRPQNGKEIADWIRAAEGELKDVVSVLSDEELCEKTIDLGGGWALPYVTQFHVYREALLIFFGRLDIYLRLIGKARPERWTQWVG